MPIITGPIARQGAVIDVLVGVPDELRRSLQSAGSPVPAAIPVRAVIDTGAGVTGFSPRVFRSLGLAAVGNIAISTPSTPVASPYSAPGHEVSLGFVASGAVHDFGEAFVIEADCFHPAEGIDGLIGRDVLDHCSFEYWGPSRAFQFAF